MKRRLFPRRVLVAAAAAAVTVAAVTVIPASPAGATTPTPTPGASAYAAGGNTGTANLRPNLQLTNLLSSYAWAIDPIVTTALDPLLQSLTATINSTVASVLGNSSSLNASTPAYQGGSAPAAFPADAMPSPCAASSTTQPCFNATSGTAVNAAPLATVGLNLIAGYTQQVPTASDPTNSIFGRAQVTSPSIAVLPGIASLVNPIVSAGVVDAKANCPNDGPVGSTRPTTAPTALVSATNVQVLGSLISLNVDQLTGQIANLSVAGVSYGTLANLPAALSAAGMTISAYGSALLVSIPLSPTQILGALGLPSDVVTQLLGYATGSTLTLNVIVGPNSTVTATSAQAWGLGIGVDLSGSLAFNLLGLVGATVAIPSGITGGNLGNLLDVRLGYASCQSGINSGGGGGGSTGGTPTPAVPPALV